MNGKGDKRRPCNEKSYAENWDRIFGQPPKLTSWFTFGQGHVHTVDGFTYDKDIVVKITARQPRAVMVEWFGLKWAFEYSKQPDMRYFSRGVKEINL